MIDHKILLDDKILDDSFCIEPDLEEQIDRFVAVMYRLTDKCEPIVIPFKQEDDDV